MVLLETQILPQWIIFPVKLSLFIRVLMITLQINLNIILIVTTTTENKWNNQLSMSCVGGVSEVVTDATLWVPNKKEWQDDMKPDPHIFTFLSP